MPPYALASLACSIAWLVICCLCPSGLRAAQTVSLPITIDYELLRTLIVEEAFPGADESNTLVNEGGGCTSLVVSRPQLEQRNGLLHLEMRVDIQAGTPLAGSCFAPLSWQGYLAVYEEPSLSSEDWRLSFSTRNSELLGPNRQPATIANLLWGLIEQYAYSFVDHIAIDLAPPVNDLQDFLLPLFPQSVRERGERTLSSLRPGPVDIGPDAIRLDVLAEVETVSGATGGGDREPPDDEELRRLVSVWENWDGLLMYLVVAMAREVLTDEEEQVLRNVLLDTRYEFVNGLTDRSLSGDVVREQFVSSWEQLAPIFKRHLLRQSSGSRALGYLAFVSSADALVVFDRLGPTLGIEISTNGLVRLARMLQARPDLLEYKSLVIPELQRLFDITPLNEERPEPPDNQDVPDTSSGWRRIPGGWGLLQSAFLGNGVAHAAQPSFQEILSWKVPDGEVSAYIERVETVLMESAATVARTKTLPVGLSAMFDRLVPALAWQESCFRQFVVKDQQLTYLLSYNQTSVGLMQVNERVWRGMFSQQRLRWDIGYNADAGCQIAALYLTKYALPASTGNKSITADTLARIVYAIYNGGPAQRQKFLQRLSSGNLYDSDKLFWQKYRWVVENQTGKVSICLKGS